MYTEEINKMMDDVQLFFNEFKIPVLNGKNFKTHFFRERLTFQEFSKFFNNTSLTSYDYYKNISKRIFSFREALIEFVEKDDFINVWKKMSKDEKNALINFDEDSYVILRSKLTKEDVIEINWSELVKEMSIVWNKDFSSKLNLSNDFLNPPENKIKTLKQKFFLMEQGFLEVEVESVYSSVEPDVIAKNLFCLIIEKGNNVKDITDNFFNSMPWWLIANVKFVEDQENRLKRNSKLKLK